MPENSTQTEAAQVTPDVNAQLAQAITGLTELLSKPQPAPAKSEAKPADRIYTSAELKQFVDSGAITQEQADGYLANVRDRQLEERLTQKLSGTLTKQQRDAQVKSQIAKYAEAKPELEKAGSQERKSVERHFDRLVNVLGYDADDPRTELLALEREFGDPDSLKPAKETTGNKVTRRTAGGASGQSGGGGTTDGPPSWLPPNTAQFYQKEIASRRYSGWEDPKLQKELAFIKKKNAR